MEETIEKIANQNKGKDTYCKNHPTISSGYFLTEQPWIKYCKNCALNVALCGRKIQKELTPQQFQRKRQISSIVNELKKSIDLIQQNSIFYKSLTDILEQAAKPISDKLAEVDKALKQLIDTKDWIMNYYDEQITNKITVYLQKQKHCGQNSQQIKKELQDIQSNFGNLIETKDTRQFQTHTSKWNQILLSNKKEIIGTQEFYQIKNQIDETMNTFSLQFQKLTFFRFDTYFDMRLFPVSKYSQTQCDSTLIPIDQNTRNSNNLVEELKLNLRANAQLKKNSKKMPTDREPKKSKRQSYGLTQNMFDPTANKRNIH